MALLPESRCARDTDCVDGLCGLDIDGSADDEAARLHCLAPADAGTGSRDAPEAEPLPEPGSMCEGPEDCVRGLCTLTGRCVIPCAEADDCVAVEGAGAAALRCGITGLRHSASTTVRALACLPWWFVPPEVSVSAVERMSISGGNTQTWSFDMHPDAQSLTVPTEVARVTPLSLQDESLSGEERTPFDAMLLVPGGVAPRISLDARTSMLLFSPVGSTWAQALSSPVADGALVPWSLSLRTDEDTELYRTGFRRDALVGTAQLDLDLLYLGGGDWSAEDPEDRAAVEAILEAVEVILEGADVRFGARRHHEVPGAARERLGTMVSEEPRLAPELRALFRLAAPSATPSLPIFLVRSLGAGIAGYAGAIGAASGWTGGPASGVVISVDLLIDDSELFARVVAHEILHALGLFHTTEIQGVTRESIADTPQCPLEADTSGDGVLSAEECAAFDGGNLMFWQSSGESLTPLQAKRARRALVLH